MQITARASAGAVQGDNFGFVLLRRGSDVRRIPYAFRVSRSSLTGAPVTALKTMQSGDTRTGEDRASVYRWPTSPFSILGIFGVDPAVNDDGKEKIYSLDITRQAVNAGVVVVRPAPKLDASITALLSSNQPIHPWFMGSLDENDVLGYAGIPVNVNGQLPDFLYSIGTAGGVFLPPGRYYVSVDSGRDLFNGRSLAGRYTLRSWVNDVRPPTVRIITRTLSSGRPTIVAKITDAKSGVDPLALQLFFGPSTRRTSVGATLFDPATGIAAFSMPREALPLETGHAVHAGRRVRLPGVEEHQHGLRQPASEHAVPGAPCRSGEPPDHHLDHAREGEVPRGAPEAARRGERQRADLVRRLLRRQPADRPRPQERRRALRDDVAYGRQAQGRTHAHRGRLGRARARGRGEPDRPDLQVIAATRFGRPLPDGGTIGVAAAASPYDSRSDVLRGVEWWEARGYRVKLAEGVWDRDDYVAGDAKRRGEDLNALFADPEVDVVQALQGGFGSAQAIPYLDFDLIAENPKPLVGFSDLTALHVAIRQRAGVATIYGNGLMGVGAVETTAFTKDRLLDVLRTGGAGEVPHDPDDPWVRSLHGGRVTAPLVGGCLWLLMQTMGTPWEIELDGAILFFEDTHTPPYYLDGQLVQLAHAGKLEQVAGVVVGQMEKSDYGDLRPVSDWARSRTIEDVLEERLEPLGVPAIYGLPLGHTKHLAALPLGVTCTLDADAKTLTVDEPALR